MIGKVKLENSNELTGLMIEEIPKRILAQDESR
jgi:hypothetical protein